jgi:hypothetical protein
MQIPATTRARTLRRSVIGECADRGGAPSCRRAIAS